MSLHLAAKYGHRLCRRGITAAPPTNAELTLNRLSKGYIPE